MSHPSASARRSAATHKQLFRTYRMRAIFFTAITVTCAGIVEWVQPRSLSVRAVLWVVACSFLIGVISDINAAFDHWKAARDSDASHE
jgi:hypothetical protein